MTGVEKIMARIEEDCQAACVDIISKAQAEAQVNSKGRRSQSRRAESRENLGCESQM